MTKAKEIGTILAAALCLFCYVWGYVLAELTLLPMWCPVAVAAALTAGSCLLFCNGWQRLTGIGSRGWSVLAYLFFVGAVCWFTPLMLNSGAADPASAYEEPVTVVGKEHMTRTKYRRVRRRRQVAVGVSHTYYLRVRFADGLEKRYPVSANEYSRAREEDEKILTLRRGFLGIPVIRR